jgi:hypothetical protein
MDGCLSFLQSQSLPFDFVVELDYLIRLFLPKHFTIPEYVLTMHLLKPLLLQVYEFWQALPNWVRDLAPFVQM